MAQSLVELVLPTRCAGCGRPGEAWCSRCAATVPPPPTLPGVPGCDVVIVGGAYEAHLRRAVLALKREHRSAAAAVANALWRDALGPVEVDCVTWVPAGSGRRSRGFDQGRTLALVAARTIDRPVLALLRRAGGGQRGLQAADRRANARVAITTRGDAIPGCVLVVDDVLTTGASLEQSARALRAAGARKVVAAVLAAARPPSRETRQTSKIYGAGPIEDGAERTRKQPSEHEEET